MPTKFDPDIQPGPLFWSCPQIRSDWPQAAYLLSRGIDTLQGVSGVRACLYGHEEHPAITSLVETSDGPTTVQFTVLDPDGKHRRFMQGHGPDGGAVRLINRGYDHLFVSEGVENALSHWILTGRPRHATYWAALSCGNLKNLELPDGPKGHLTILYDKDKGQQGLAAAQERAALAEESGWKVSLSGPPSVEYGDWNDELQLFLKEKNNV